MPTSPLSDALQKRTFIPDGTEPQAALARTTHLGVGAHQDDLEFMALHGILECFGSAQRWFGGITCTDGAGSARSGVYADYSDAQMRAVRHREQETAAVIGGYSFMSQLGYSSSEVKKPQPDAFISDLAALLRAARPQVVYTHNPADKHASHIGVFSALLKAIRSLPAAERPQKLIGCEVWRGLDWLCDERKVRMPTDAHPNLAAALSGVFDSQITGGKRYDLAVQGRRLANATFFDSHSVDNVSQQIYGMDLTPLIEDDSLSVQAFVREAIDAFARSADAALASYFQP